MILDLIVFLLVMSIFAVYIFGLCYKQCADLKLLYLPDQWNL